MSVGLDRRLTPARLDVAAAYLKGTVEAARFVEGRALRVARGVVPLRAAASDDAAQETQLLFGESFTVYDSRGGWVWGQAELNSYVGYAPESAFGESTPAPAHRVAALATPLLSAPDAKRAARDMLPLNAKVSLTHSEGRFAQLGDGQYVFAAHLAPLSSQAPDWVAVAERFLGVPYLWGGKTHAGLDCSGLVQTALEAAGISAPRDTDMMEVALGRSLEPETALRRGDLIFWQGHVGLMVDGETLLHANGFAMQVSREPLAEVRQRTVAREGLEVRTMKRL